MSPMIKQHADDPALLDDTKWFGVAKKTFTVYSTAFTPQLAVGDYTWTVDLLDRKRNSLLAAPLVLGPETWDSCPSIGTSIVDPYTAP